MSIGGGHPDISGLELAWTCVLPGIEEGRMDPEHVLRLNEVFALGLDEEALANIRDHIGVVRERLRAFFDGNGDYHDAMDRFHVMTDFLDEVHGKPEHERRPVVLEAHDLKRLFDARMRRMLRGVLSGPKWSRMDAIKRARVKVLGELGVLDEPGNVIPGKEALLKAFEGLYIV